mmetsp:Transcript_26396/g.57879  ORF Transcript_26396/g.57879 Transcript_26396/m.57879 type:complete len:790 (+) Transcript_26396:259-2628(+)
MSSSSGSGNGSLGSPTSVLAGATSSDPKELILAYLRKEKIKLWLPPYYDGNIVGSNRAISGSNDEALQKLAKELLTRLPSTAIENRDAVDAEKQKEQIYYAILELQSHAVQRLIEKNTVDVKILGLAVPLPHDICTTTGPLADWGDSVSIANTQGGKTTLRITNVSANLTVDTFTSDLRSALNVESVRVIWKGKNLSSSSSSDGESVRIRKVLSSGKSTDKKKQCELLCIVSGGSTTPHPASSSSSADTDSAASTERTDQSIIASIRAAARTMQSSSSASQFEITDQSGNLVPMSQSDSASFLTALGLHRLGRTKMDERSSDGSTSSRQDAIGSALVFLLEADAEWSNPALESWKHKTDNYALLQLDIAWQYLRLESLDSLPDAVTRLDIAEAALRKQVHSNFITLALVQAEMNNPIPPLCALFVRLFLLQGIAKKVGRGDHEAEGEQRLEWARVFCNRLRSVCPADTVDHLCNAYLVDRFTAVSALRRSNGDPEVAGNLICVGRNEENHAERRRRRQQRIGRCSNGVDYVNMDAAPVLCGMLGFSVTQSFDNTSVDDYDENMDNEGERNEPCMGTSIVIGLLRLCDNDIDRALSLYQQCGAEEVLNRVKKLNEQTGKRKRSRDGESKKQALYDVRDVDLTMLMSMGVEESRAREALRMTGNVDVALLWLSQSEGSNSSGGPSLGDADRLNDEHRHTRSSSGTVVAPTDPTTSYNGNLISSDDSSAHTSGDGTSSSISSPSREELESRAAQELLTRELGMAIRDDSKELEKEWLGMDMNEEWALIEKYK